MTAALPPPGWYPDPDGTPQRLRWWNGVQWSATTRPVDPAAVPAAAPVSPPPGADVRERQPAGRRGVWITLGVAGLLVVVLAVAGALRGGPGAGTGTAGRGGAGPSAPPLAVLCPPPSATPETPRGGATPAPAGPRVTDPDAGFSYAAQPAPWRPWDQGTWTGGDLGVEFRHGYYFVTETYGMGEEYLASVLSGSVPATVNDGLTLDLECTGRQVAEDVRRSFYPSPNSKELVRDERTTVGGRPAWVQVFRLSFHEAGLKARSELVAVVLVDVGRPTAGVLYLSIPDTHRRYEKIVDGVIASIRPTG